MAGLLSALKKEIAGESVTSAHTPERAWSPQVFDDIEWRRFEALCEALFGQAGVRTERAIRMGPTAASISGCTRRTARSP